jgi:hypothetical protein
MLLQMKSLTLNQALPQFRALSGVTTGTFTGQPSDVVLSAKEAEGRYKDFSARLKVNPIL